MVAAEEVRERAEMRAKLRIDFILMGCCWCWCWCW